MRVRNVLSTGSLFLLLAFCSEDVSARVDHFTFSTIASPQRAGVPFQITVTARDSNNVPVTNFSAPVELLYSNAAAPALLSDFETGVGGWWMGDYAPVPILEAAQFDTDGDGVTNGAGRITFVRNGGILYHAVDLIADTTYEVSVEFALTRETDVPGSERFIMDALYFTYFTGSSSQLALAGLGPVAPHQVARATVTAEYTAPFTRNYLIALRMGLEYPGDGLRVYVDNVRVRPREVTPIVLNFTQGQWTGDISVFRPGGNQMLQVIDGAGHAGASNPFDVSESGDLSVTIPDTGWIPAGAEAQYSVVLFNVGPTTVTGIRVTNDLPADVVFLFAEGPASCALDGDDVVCDLPALAPNESAKTVLHVIQAQPGDALVRASVFAQSADPQISNNLATQSLHFVPIIQGGNVIVSERPGGANAVFNFQLNAPSTNEIVVACAVMPLSATEGIDYVAPLATLIVFPPGTTNQAFTVGVLDDALHEPEQTFLLALSVASNMPAVLLQQSLSATILDDDPAPTLSVTLPASAAETSGTLTNQGIVTLSAPLDGDLLVSLSSSDTTELIVPASITITQGQTSAHFNLQIKDDNLLDGAQSVIVTAQVTNWLFASSGMEVTDNEPAVLTLQAALPSALREGYGVINNSFRVLSAAPVTTNVTVALESSDTSELIVPASITITAGQSFAYFPVTVVDDTETDGPQTAMLGATAPGFTGASVNVGVGDNDVHHFTFSSLPGRALSITSTVPFSFSVFAREISNATVSYTGSVTLRATGDLGFVEFYPTNVTGFGIQGAGAFVSKATISNGFHTNVRIIADDGHGHTGESNPFTVHAAPSQQTRIVGVGRLGGDVHLHINTVAGRSYRIEAAPEPQGPWNTVAPNVAGTGGTVLWTDTNAVQQLQRFYRLALQAEPAP